MADITMCRGDDCYMKEACYRHTAPQNPHWQAWFMNTPQHKGSDCEFFSPSDTPPPTENEEEDV